MTPLHIRHLIGIQAKHVRHPLFFDHCYDNIHDMCIHSDGFNTMDALLHLNIFIAPSRFATSAQIHACACLVYTYAHMYVCVCIYSINDCFVFTCMYILHVCFMLVFTYAYLCMLYMKFACMYVCSYMFC